jgi:hypothetical protein
MEVTFEDEDMSIRLDLWKNFPDQKKQDFQQRISLFDCLDFISFPHCGINLCEVSSQRW